ncbi:MAG: hypothetical protein EOO75_12755 [Myxococcales bacterium]|nr:MAG: hypothetical protein EOO75_12755 [Myxococcales bacterium]
MPPLPWRLAPIALAASALLLALARPAVALDPAPRWRVVVMGDSLSDPRSAGGGYLRAPAARCPDSTFESQAKGGEMVNQMRRRFGRDVLARKPTHVLVMGGVNDLYSDLTAGRTVAKITADLALMYAAARADGAKVIALTVAPWGGFKHFSEHRAATTRELNAWITAQQAAGKVDQVLDTTPLLSCGNPDRLCDGLGQKDGLHWTRAAHDKVGEALAAGALAGCARQQ